jgi:iron complex transport system ATP-binding protein
MIELQNISFSYDREVLRDISLHFAPGCFCGILGPNGCGKTTLMRLLAGLTAPAQGSMTLCGRPYAAWRRRELARQLALLPQDRPVPELTVGECVALGRYPHGNGRSADDRRAVAQAMADTGTEALRGRLVSQLSGGERQRVGLAMLLAQETPVVLLDEPTAALDAAHQFAVMDILRQARDRGRCVIAVLHDLPLALRYCDRVILLSGGQVRFAGKPAEAVASGALEAVFGVRCIPVPQGGEGAFFIGPSEK